MSPLGPGGQTLVGGSHQIAINSQSENVEAAWTFAKFYTGTEAQAIPLQQGYPSVRKSSLSLVPIDETMEIIARPPKSLVTVQRRARRVAISAFVVEGKA